MKFMSTLNHPHTVTKAELLHVNRKIDRDEEENRLIWISVESA
jgi:hypothetical protein